MMLVYEGEAVQPRGADIPPLPLPGHCLWPVDGGVDGGLRVDLVEGGEHLLRPPVLVQPVVDDSDFHALLLLISHNPSTYHLVVKHG